LEQQLSTLLHVLMTLLSVVSDNPRDLQILDNQAVQYSITRSIWEFSVFWFDLDLSIPRCADFSTVALSS
jgi:hypothetical protein